MGINPFKFLLSVWCVFMVSPAFTQSQSCPVNSNFSLGNLTNWSAYTGNNAGGNGPSSIRQTYDAANGAPSGTLGVITIPEYQLPSVNGIKVNTTQGSDFFGGFPTIPTINGYNYNYSVILGSTAISTGGGGAQGGYVRGISYLINVPTSATIEPYTMTYAYAMVLEDGTHNSDQQPLISATLTTNTGVITCASPSYFLPTFNNTTNGSQGATLDTATAINNGFRLSSQPSPNPSRRNGGASTFQFDVWTKDWTEVTFDLSAYRGQQVTLTFEADNCVPGGHFAYGYIALRNTCAGLTISGNPIACANSEITYSIPALAEGTYDWEVPSGWTIVSGLNSNIIVVKPGVGGGNLIAHEINGCADLRDTIRVSTTDPTIAGRLIGDNNVCTGINASTLTLTGYNGNVLRWVSTSNGVSWNNIAVTTPSYITNNLTSTTIFKAIVQNGPSCAIDSSTSVKVVVDPKSEGGLISPSQLNICIGQNAGAVLTLARNTGNILNWQSSQDNIVWNDFNPAYTNPVYSISGVSVPTRFRVVVKSGTCPPDTSLLANVNIINVPFPATTFSPADTTICYGTTATLNARILIGSSYAWNNITTLVSPGNGLVTSTPYSINAVVSPLATTRYILRTENAGCPNVLRDTFNVKVLEPIIVNAGNDTSVVINQPLQLLAKVAGTSGDDMYSWSPSLGLNNAAVFNPIAVFSNTVSTIRYTVKVTSSDGCAATDDILVKVFRTSPDIFVPNAFTPGKSTNNIFRPIPVGVASLRYFRVYNRWGQLVYSTSSIGEGWDGLIKGKQQGTQTFVWMLEGSTYDGRVINKKGTVVLAR